MGLGQLVIQEFESMEHQPFDTAEIGIDAK